MRREPDSIMTLIPTLLDFKLANIKVDEGNLRVFTIQDFLAQYNINTRTVGIHAILVPNNFTSTTDYNLNNYRTLIGNFTVKYYHFVGGFTDDKFVELKFELSQSVINQITSTVTFSVISNLLFNDTEDVDFSKLGNNVSAITIGWTGRFKDLDGRTVNVSHGLIKNVWKSEEVPVTLTVINGIIINPDYGYLYNHYLAVNNKLGNNNFKVCSKQDWLDILSYYGTSQIARLLRVSGYNFWDTEWFGTPIEEGTNYSKFSAVGSGEFDQDAEMFSPLHKFCKLWTSDIDENGNGISINIFGYDNNVDFDFRSRNAGYSIRLVNTNTLLTHGQYGTYIGNDGKRYSTVAIGNPAKEFICSNLKETLLNDGSPILYNDDPSFNKSWFNAVEGMYCIHGNLMSPYIPNNSNSIFAKVRGDKDNIISLSFTFQGLFEGNATSISWFVDWGDGSAIELNGTEHTYPLDREYSIKVATKHNDDVLILSIDCNSGECYNLDFTNLNNLQSTNLNNVTTI